MNTLIVFLSGKSTTLPGPTVHGPPNKVMNLVLIPVTVIKLIAICKAHPVALF